LVRAERGGDLFRSVACDRLTDCVILRLLKSFYLGKLLRDLLRFYIRG
jgi:hypothetical protein